MVEMRSVLLCALAGCNQLYGLEGTRLQTPDAPIDAPGCSGSMFVDPQTLGTVFEPGDFDPRTSGDPTELWFSRANGNYDIWVARRDGDTGPVETASPFPYNSATANDGDPAFTSDGRVLVFLSQRISGQAVYEARRPAVGAAFAAPTPIAIDGGGGDAGIDLTPDGLTLYFVDPFRQLRAIHRSSLEQPFGNPGPALASAVVWPSLSPDELELYYQNPDGDGVFRRTRASTTLPFDATEMQVLSGGGDPDVSADSRRLYFSNGGVSVMTRACN